MNCPCQSGKPFAKCCDRFLNQGQFAKTPEQLMRSRFSAFSLGGYGEYLLATWSHSPRSSQACRGEHVEGSLSATDLSQKTTDWCGLKIINKSQSGNQGMVEFKAFYLDSNGEIACHHEKSLFERSGGHWLYVSGDVVKVM